jgi:hypothetical protein
MIDIKTKILLLIIGFIFLICMYKFNKHINLNGECKCLKCNCQKGKECNCANCDCGCGCDKCSTRTARELRKMDELTRNIYLDNYLSGTAKFDYSTEPVYLLPSDKEQKKSEKILLDNMVYLDLENDMLNMSLVPDGKPFIIP